jgi:hypothetical protein
MRKKITFNPELIKEEAKRFKLLTEYSFYHEENVMAPSGKAQKPIILGNELEEAEEDPQAGEEQDPQGFDQAAGMEDQSPDETGTEEMPAPEGEEDTNISFDAPAEDNLNIDTSAVDPNIKAVQDALTQAQKVAQKTGDDKLVRQINNTITMFTRDHIANTEPIANEVPEPIREYFDEDEDYDEGAYYNTEDY